MKTIKQHIHERLILHKSGNSKEITFEMLFDALDNMKRLLLHLADIWTPDELPTIPEGIKIKDMDVEKYVGEQIKTISSSAIAEGNDPYIRLSLFSKRNGNSFIYIVNTDELYEIFTESQLQQILREALINKR
jgi:hypothetical protein